MPENVRQELVKRSKRLAFMKTGDNTYTMMKKFTSFSESKNPKEYARQYVEDDFETTDVVGYATSKSFEFDRYKGNAVQGVLSGIFDEELTGLEAQVEIVVVDLFDPVAAETPNTCNARRRIWSVIPDGSGDGTDSLKYTGTLKAVGALEKGTATTADNWETVTFAAEEAAQ